MRYLTISEVSDFLNVSIVTLRRWSKSGKLVESFRSVGGHRRYSSSDLERFLGREAPQPVPRARLTILYSRVSSKKQEDDLARQMAEVRKFAAARGLTGFLEISDVGSGLNFKKRGFARMLGMLMRGEVGEIIVAHKDRLLRFGVDMFAICCEENGVRLTFIDSAEQKRTPQEEMAADIIAICTSFSCKTNGLRAGENRKKRNAA